MFDAEFIGGTSLQGSCDNFRGKLVPWSALLKLTPATYADAPAADKPADAAARAATPPRSASANSIVDGTPSDAFM